MSGLSLDDLIQTQQGTRGGDEQISVRSVNNTPSFIHTPSQCCGNGARKYNLIKVKDLACPRRNNPPITNTHTHEHSCTRLPKHPSVCRGGGVGGDTKDVDAADGITVHPSDTATTTQHPVCLVEVAGDDSGKRGG